MQRATPTARALLALEVLQDSPGVSAERLARKLEITDRAVRRYVRLLRDAGIPIESTPLTPRAARSTRSSGCCPPRSRSRSRRSAR